MSNQIQLRIVITLLSVGFVAGSLRAAQPIAFPGAEGFGANATGGRGGAVYHVTNLDDTGPGSFRDGVSQPNRIVIFDIGGIVNLKSNVTCSSNLTIAGQSAPGGGITINGRGFSLSGVSNVIIRHVRFRSSHETSEGTKTLNITNGSNIIVDHCSISWGRWDNLGFTVGSHEITLQDCINSEAINPQKFGALIDTAKNVTVVRTLWIDNQSRNPKGKADMQYINNVIYNWGGTGYAGGHSAAVWNQDMINNYFIKGPSSNDSLLGQFTPTDHMYQKGNKVDLNRDGVLNGVDVKESDFKANGADSGTATFMPGPFNKPPVPVAIVSAEEAYNHIVKYAGASLRRDEVDTRIIKQLLSLGKEGAIINDEMVVGGAGTVAGGIAPADQDKDGIPDAWETSHGLNPANPADATQINADSDYTNIEVYLNSLVSESELPA